jgi:putative transposase
MATRYYTFAPGEYYHVYNRGNSKQEIFKGASDYDRFVKTLHLANSPEAFKIKHFADIDIFDEKHKEPLVHVGAYCLMTNHFHLLLTPAQKDGIPQFMLRLGTSYATYFNKKHDRTGSLFEGSYKARYADSDRYLKYLFSYIHLNPFRDSEGNTKRLTTIDTLASYPYSSLPDYLGVERKQGVIISPEKFPQYFNTPREHHRELFDWLDFQEN